MTIQLPRPGRAHVVDDDEGQRLLIRACLERAGYDVRTFDDGVSFLAEIEHDPPDVVCLDLRMPRLHGLEVLERARRALPGLPVVVVSGTSGVDDVVNAIHGGAADYLVKPVDPKRLLDVLEAAIERAVASDPGGDEPARDDEGRPGRSLLGSSSSMRAVRRRIARVAASDISVLIRGESGTGKELVARSIHEQSSRRDGPFVPVNCAAIPESLQESELFGHERGSFTGASSRRIGRFEQADGGTLFLDEIGELTPSSQAKLLRALQERAFHRVGGANEVRSDFRLLAATHRDLDAALSDGTFREDLYFRVAVFELELPALRDRGDDVLLLASRMLRRMAAAHGRDVPSMPAEVREALRVYDWPGNVRELRNAVEHALVAAEGSALSVADLPSRIVRWWETTGEAELEPDREPPPPGDPARSTGSTRPLAELEREAIVRAIEQSGGNICEAGRRLGMPRSTLYRRLRRYGLR